MSYALDTTGDSLQNLVIGEVMEFSLSSSNTVYNVLPILSGPFFADTIKVRYTNSSNVSRILTLGVDYKVGYVYKAATDACNRLVAACIYFMDQTLVGSVTYTLQTLGGTYAINTTLAGSIRNAELRDPEIVTWEQVCAARSFALATFPTVTHPYLKTTSADYAAMVQALDEAGLAVHLRPAFLPTPDQVAFIPTKAEVGLSLVNNFATATDQQAASGTATNLYVTPKGAALAAAGVVSAQLAAQGYKVATDYAATLNVTDPMQMYSYQNDLYIPRPSALPFTTSGVFETQKFMLVNSNRRDAWTEVVISVTGNESIDAAGGRVLTTGLTLLSGMESRVVINDLIEAVGDTDYRLTPTKLVVYYPLSANDVVVLSVKPKKSRVADTAPYYASITVNSTLTGDFTIPALDNVDPTDLRVVLNDLLTLSRVKSDYTISGTTLHINYPLALGDVIEVMTLDSTSPIGRLNLRNLLTI
jgi:hypothetical protein